MFGWAQSVLMILGVWLATSPSVLDYHSAALQWSDVVAGVAVAALAAGAVGPLGMKAGIANCFVGVWVLFAPLVFWAPSPTTYLNDTLVGALVIVFSLLIPMSHEMEGPDVPAGWSYNPSTWQQRAPIIAFGFFGFFVSRYMAAYQLGYVDHAWDPFFRGGTERVLHSDVSKAWPVSDAGLGAMTYLIETLSGLMGDKRRWRTMPWMVAIFGFAVIPLGVVSIVLVIMQPLVVGAWCTLCLATAAAMLAMIALSLDEVVAMIQFVARSRKEGGSAWRTFWLGGDAAAGQERAPVRPSPWRPRAMLWGFTPSAALLGTTLTGLWLMAAPDIFGIAINAPAADSDHLTGALIVVVSVIAMAEVGRPTRFLNLLLGAWLLIAPWLLAGATSATRANDIVAGALAIGLSLPLGRVRDHYGTFDRGVSFGFHRARRASA